MGTVFGCPGVACEDNYRRRGGPYSIMVALLDNLSGITAAIPNQEAAGEEREDDPCLDPCLVSPLRSPSAACASILGG
jgi:hypothetical protein